MLFSVLDTCFLQIKFFHKVETIPAPVTDTEKLVCSVLEAERPLFRYFLMSTFSFTCWMNLCYPIFHCYWCTECYLDLFTSFCFAVICMENLLLRQTSFSLRHIKVIIYQFEY